MKQQEQPTFTVGDRFRLMRPISSALDGKELDRLVSAGCTDFSSATGDYFAGLKGWVIETGVWECELDDYQPFPYCLVRFDAFPEREVFCWHLEQVAAKAMGDSHE